MLKQNVDPAHSSLQTGGPPPTLLFLVFIHVDEPRSSVPSSANPRAVCVSLRGLLRGPAVPHFLPACLFKVVFVYAEAQLSETCAGSVLGSFHRGSILFLIKWHSVAGGLAGTQLPGKPKNAGLHLATNSYCLRRLVLHSAPQCYCC